MSSGDPSETTVDRVAELLRTAVGLKPEPTLRARLRRCIRDEAARLTVDAETYIQALTTSTTLRQALLNRVTVQETGFFRHPEHFDVLMREILPTLTPPLTIWSAGCANGQEAFSLVMLLEELGIDGSVIATDVSTAALRRTSAARYSDREISGLTPTRIKRHLTRAGLEWQVNQSLRDRVSTLHHNLIAPVPDQARGSQVVFCRNVLIYFSTEHARIFLDRIANALPTAWVFLGAAETIWSIGDRYETVRIGGAYAYRPRVEEGAIPAVVSAMPAAGSVAAGSVLRLPSAAGAESEPETGSRAGFGSGADVADDSAAIARLVRDGQDALAARNDQAAVVLFRKWVYLAQDDALAHLHLALALEAVGDQASAHRAFGASRRALLESDPAQISAAVGGYDAAELRALLDGRQPDAARSETARSDAVPSATGQSVAWRPDKQQEFS